MYDDIAYLNIALPEDIQKKKWYGDFEGAIRLIDRRLSLDISEALRKKLVLEREILRLLPLDYPYSSEEAVKYAKERIPDFTQEELKELEEAGRIDWIYVQGKVRYFGRFLETLLVTDPAFAARARREEEEDNSAKRSFLDDTMRLMKREGRLTRRFRIRAYLKIRDEAFVPGKKVRVYLPVPIDCMQVKDARILASEPEIRSVALPAAAQRTVYFEAAPEENRPFWVEYEYENTVNYVEPRPEETAEALRRGVKPLEAFNPRTDIPGHGKPTLADIAEQAPHITFTPYIRALREELAGGETNPLITARRFYDFITTKVNYSFMRDYFTIENIPEYAALNLKADCGVQALLFITLCRLAGIPARWQSGLYSTPKSAGSHDWAQFYVEPYGWLFADCSFGGSAYRNGQLERWNFYFGNLDPYRMPANCVFQTEFDPPKKYFRNDPYDNQSGEAEYEDRALGSEELECYRTVLSCE